MRLPDAECVLQKVREEEGIEFSYISITLHTLRQDVITICRPLLPSHHLTAALFLQKCLAVNAYDALCQDSTQLQGPSKRYQYTGFSSRNHKASKYHQDITTSPATHLSLATEQY
jgi:hypothetical protein